MKMAAVLFLVFFAAIGVNLSEAVCRGEFEKDGVRKVTEVKPENCWYFCRRYYGKGGVCETGTEDARCICNGEGELVDVGSCSKEKGPDGIYQWIGDCNAYCTSTMERYNGGECSWTWSTFSRRCYCRNSDEDRGNFRVPRDGAEGLGTTAAPE